VSLYLDASVIVSTMVDDGSSAVVEQFTKAAAEPLIVGEFDAWRAAKTSNLDLQSADLRLSGAFVRRFKLGLRAPDALHAAVCQRGGHTLVTLAARLAAAAEAPGVRVDCLA
jgi:predicted nucleic acid-binding protein